MCQNEISAEMLMVLIRSSRGGVPVSVVACYSLAFILACGLDKSTIEIQLRQWGSAELMLR